MITPPLQHWDAPRTALSKTQSRSHAKQEATVFNFPVWSH
uniref:Uncharacterized protein n=1 Tax=Anguilla anguilla TaxID=7936 RepID=A0A0E9ULS2_ANGAN